MAKELVLRLKILGTDKEIKTIAELKGAIKSATTELETQTKIGSKEYNILRNRIADAKAELKNFQREQQNQVKGFQSLKFASGSYREIQATVAVATERLRTLSVGINATQEEFDTLKTKVQAGKIALADFDREIGASNQLVGEYDRGIIKAFKDLGLIDLAEKQFQRLTSEQKRLTDEVDRLGKEYKEAGVEGKKSSDAIEKELRDVVSQLEKVNGQVDSAKKEMGELGSIGQKITTGLVDGFKQVGQTLLIGFSALGAVQLGRDIVAINASINDSLADVAKTTGLTTDEVNGLFEELKKLETRTSLEERLDIAKIAGQLGIAKEEVIGFTEAIDKITVALGDELGGDVEQIATDLGKINEVFNVSDALGVSGGLNAIASSINELGASGTANAGFIVDFTQRLGGIAPQAKISVDEIIGLAGTLDELGISSEVSSSALIKLLTSIGEDVPTFAKIAGQSVEDFNETLERSGNEALVAVLRGAEQSGEGLGALSEQLKKLGIEDVRSTQAIGALANNLDLLTEKQRISKEAFEEGTSVTEEFAKKNQTLQAEFDKLTNTVQGFIVSANFQQTLSGGISGLNQFVKVLASLPEVISENKELLIGLGVAVASFNAQLIISKSAQLADIAIKKIQAVTTSIVTTAQTALNTAMKSNPIGLVVSAIALVVTGLIALEKKFGVVSATMKGFASFVRELFSVVAETVQGFAEGFDAITSGDVTGGLKKIGASLVNLNPVGLAIKQGERLGNAFVDGYSESMENFNEKNKEVTESTVDVTESIDKVAESQNKLKTSTKGLTDEQKKQIQMFRNLVDESRDFATALSDEEMKKLKKAIDEQTKLRQDEQKKIQELTLKLAMETTDLLIANIDDEKDREIEKENEAFKRKQTEIKKNLEEILAIESISSEQKQIAEDEANKLSEQLLLNHLKNLSDITEKHANDEREKKLKRIQDDLNSLDDDGEIVQLKLEERLATGALTEEEFNKQSLESKKRLLEAKLQLVESEIIPIQASIDEQIELGEEGNNELLRQQQELNTEIANLEQELTELVITERQKRLQDFQDKFSIASQFIDEGLSTLEDVFSTIADRQIEEELRIQESKEENIQRLQEQLDSASETDKQRIKQQLAKETEELEKSKANQEKIERKFARQKKGIKIIEVGMQTAQNALQAYSVGLQAGFPQGLILAPILAGIAVAFGAIQAGIVASAPLAKGGELTDVEGGNIPMGAGVITGRRHGSKGVRFKRNGRQYEAENGELKTNNGDDMFVFTRGVNDDPVLRRLALATHTSRKHPASRMVASIVNQFGGGSAFPGAGYMFDTGGVVPSLGQPLNQPNIVFNDNSIPEFAKLFASINETNQKLEQRINQVEQNFNDTKLVVPVDKVTRLQEEEVKSREAGLF